MADEALTNALNQGNDGKVPPKDGQEPTTPNEGYRTSHRIDTLLTKLSDTSAERDKAQKELAEERFKNQFTAVTGKYKHAAEHEQEIRERAAKTGDSVEDAAVVILNKAGKLELNAPAPDPAADGHDTARTTSLGGSADTGQLTPTGKKDPKDMTQAERLSELQQAEAAGDLALS